MQVPEMDPQLPSAWQVLETVPEVPPVQEAWTVTKESVAGQKAFPEVSEAHRFLVHWLVTKEAQDPPGWHCLQGFPE